MSNKREFLDRYCVIDSETTGVVPRYHDAIEIGSIVLDEYFDIDKRSNPFHILMWPSRPDNVDIEAITTQQTADGKKLTLKKWHEVLRHGLTPTKAGDLFVEWFEKLKLPPKGRLIPIAHNWPFDREFIKDWIGDKTFEYIFAHSYIDTFPLCKFIEGTKLSRGEKSPFGISMRLGDLSRDMGYSPERSHNALDDCITTANFIKLLTKFVN